MKIKFIHLVLSGCFLFHNPVWSQWSAPVNISPGVTAPTLNEYMASCLTVSGTTLHVVWCDHRATGNSIYYTHSPDTGHTWSTPVPITDSSSSISWPAIASSGSFVHVVWFANLLGQPASFYKRSVDGGATWGSTVVLDSATKFWPGLSASGSMVVVSLNKEIVTGNTEVFIRVSTNNGAIWQPKQQVSNATGRSEDPCVAVLGTHIHLSWNDKRSGTMLTYYRHSLDGGATWGSETALSSVNSYTEMVSLNGSYVDVPHGVNPGVFNVWLSQSSDNGNTFAADNQLTNAATAAIPSWMVRDGMNLHLLYSQSATVTYLHSGDGGTTWDSPVSLHHGGLGYIAITGSTLHVIFTDSSKVYYMRNPTGNTCPAPAMPGSITGNAKPCPGTNGVSYSIAAVSGATLYNWTAPANATIASGQGTTNITINYAANFVSGTLSVKAANLCGTSNPKNKTISRNIPAMPGTISGQSTSLCGGITVSYSISPLNLATVYNWSVPAGVTINNGQGTTTLNVSFPVGFTSGTVSVTAGNSCGTSNPRNLAVKSTPAIPGTISGPNTVCANQAGVVYSISSVTGATSYTWIVPTGCVIQAGQGTISLTMQFGTTGGTVKVKANNACGSSFYKTLAVTINCRSTVKDDETHSVCINPNPLKDKLNITVKGNELVEVSLYDITARKIFHQSFVNSTSINTEQLAKGAYIYEVRNKNGVIKKGKVVKPACR